MIMDIIFIVILIWIIHYFIMSLIQTNNYTDITNNINKMYISTIMALFVAFIYVLLMDFKNNDLSTNYYISIGLVIALLVYMYKSQFAVNNYDWVSTMIESNSNNLLVNKFMASEKSNCNDENTACVKLANQFVKLNQEQINLLKLLKNNLKSNRIFY